jgi:hypothetical protein
MTVRTSPLLPDPGSETDLDVLVDELDALYPHTLRIDAQVRANDL